MPDDVKATDPKGLGGEPLREPTEAELRYCVVCGLGSHRAKWGKSQGKHVACDGHSDKEIAEAVKAQAPAATGK